jgi:hypothetical protein
LYLGVDPQESRIGAQRLECGTGEVKLAARLDVDPRGPQMLAVRKPYPCNVERPLMDVLGR